MDTNTISASSLRNLLASLEKPTLEMVVKTVSLLCAAGEEWTLCWLYELQEKLSPEEQEQWPYFCKVCRYRHAPTYHGAEMCHQCTTEEWLKSR